MGKFPIDAPISSVVKAFEKLGFRIVRTGNHISMIKDNDDGTCLPLTMPNHRIIKGSTLRTILTQARITRSDFLAVYKQ
jgi:predicted RNA binding protein YcfA (HicA-like mRNA interferase family)